MTLGYERARFDGPIGDMVTKAAQLQSAAGDWVFNSTWFFNVSYDERLLALWRVGDVESYAMMRLLTSMGDPEVGESSRRPHGTVLERHNDRGRLDLDWLLPRLLRAADLVRPCRAVGGRQPSAVLVDRESACTDRDHGAGHLGSSTSTTEWVMVAVTMELTRRVG